MYRLPALHRLNLRVLALGLSLCVSVPVSRACSLCRSMSYILNVFFFLVEDRILLSNADGINQVGLELIISLQSPSPNRRDYRPVPLGLAEHFLFKNVKVIGI